MRFHFLKQSLSGCHIASRSKKKQKWKRLLLGKEFFFWNTKKRPKLKKPWIITLKSKSFHTYWVGPPVIWLADFWLAYLVLVRMGEVCSWLEQLETSCPEDSLFSEYDPLMSIGAECDRTWLLLKVELRPRMDSTSWGTLGETPVEVSIAKRSFAEFSSFSSIVNPESLEPLAVVSSALLVFTSGLQLYNRLGCGIVLWNQLRNQGFAVFAMKIGAQLMMMIN